MKEYYFKYDFSGIEVVAKTKKEIEKVILALKFLKSKEKKYFKLLKDLKAILVLFKKDYDNLLWIREKIYICETLTILESSKEYLTSLLLHEAIHIWQYNKGKKYYGDKAEKDAYLKQRKFLVKYGKKDEVLWLDKCFKEKWWVYKGSRKIDFYDSNILINFAKKYLNGRLVLRKIK